MGLEPLPPGFFAGRVAAQIPSFLPGPVTTLTPPQGGGLQCLSCKLLSNCSVPPEEVMWLREKRCVFLWLVRARRPRQQTPLPEQRALFREPRENAIRCQGQINVLQTALGSRLATLTHLSSEA